jgi:ribosomal protein L11 methyltransferase
VTEPRLVRLALRVRAEQAEVALANLQPLLGAGAEERDLGGTIEYAVYLPPGELPPPEAIRRLAGEALLGTITEPVADGWERRYLEHLRPVTVARLTIRPPWIDGAPDDLVIDPGTMFGAGTHASTQLALELLLETEPGGALCDWGAGSGVLAIAAARLGYEPVTAVELDPAALPVIEANAAANDVAVTPLIADVHTDDVPWAPTVIANLTGPLHGSVAAALDRAPERLIASGMLARHAADVAAAYAPHGLTEVARRADGDWVAVMLA